MAALLQPEQHAALVVADELAQILEAQPAVAMPREEILHQPMGREEVPDDVDQSRFRGRASRGSIRRRAARVHDGLARPGRPG